MPELTSMTNIDGVITPTEEARVPVLDRGFLYGDSVYEVFRTYSGVPLFLAEHFDRMEKSAGLIHMRMMPGRDVLTVEIRRTLEAIGGSSDIGDVYVRLLVTRGEGPVDLYPDPDLTTRYVVIVKPLVDWDPRFYREGLKLAIPTVRRNPINALDPNIKGGNYLNNILGITQARELGADDCVILNREGLVTESASSNVWFMINDKLVTPGPNAGNLMGLTKNALHEACRAAGIGTEEIDIQADDLAKATECFVTSATREVMPVYTLMLENKRLLQFPVGGGEITRRVAQIFKTYIATYTEAHRNEKLF